MGHKFCGSSCDRGITSYLLLCTVRIGPRRSAAPWNEIVLPGSPKKIEGILGQTVIAVPHLMVAFDRSTSWDSEMHLYSVGDLKKHGLRW